MSGLVLNAEQLTRQLESTNKAICDLHDKFDHYEKTLCDVVYSMVREYIRSMIFEEWKKEHIENELNNRLQEKMNKIVYEATNNINQRVSRAVNEELNDIKEDIAEKAVSIIFDNFMSERHEILDFMIDKFRKLMGRTK